MSSVAIVILAAGASQRMGAPKLLLRHRGRTLLRLAVDAALGSSCRPVLVVLGASAPLLQPDLADLPVQVVHNLDWARGLSASIRSGIEALSSAADPPEAAVLALCDQPFVSSANLEALVTAFSSARRPIVASEYGGALGVPALFARPLWPELVALVGEAGAKRVIRAHREEVWPVPCPQGALDVDTPDDYDAVCAQPNGPPPSP